MAKTRKIFRGVMAIFMLMFMAVAMTGCNSQTQMNTNQDGTSAKTNDNQAGGPPDDMGADGPPPDDGGEAPSGQAPSGGGAAPTN